MYYTWNLLSYGGVAVTGSNAGMLIGVVQDSAHVILSGMMAYNSEAQFSNGSSTNMLTIGRKSDGEVAGEALPQTVA